LRPAHAPDLSIERDVVRMAFDTASVVRFSRRLMLRAQRRVLNDDTKPCARRQTTLPYAS
jgi:hypothetical protein